MARDSSKVFTLAHLKLESESIRSHGAGQSILPHHMSTDHVRPPFRHPDTIVPIDRAVVGPADFIGANVA